jgi:hypothetical protein
MPSVSKKQQNFFRLVKAVKDGKVKKKDVDKSVRKAAKSMTKKQVSDFADHVSEETNNTFSKCTKVLLFEDFIKLQKDLNND